MSFNTATPLKNSPGLAEFVVEFPTLDCDRYHQWSAAGMTTRAGIGLATLMAASIKYNAVITVPEKPVMNPPGTVWGVKTMFRANGVAASLLPLALPPILQTAFADIAMGMDAYTMRAAGAGYMQALAYITGCGAVTMTAYITDEGQFVVNSSEAPRSSIEVAFAAKIPHPKYAANKIGVMVWATASNVPSAPPTPLVVPDELHLYHTHKINTEIEPPHGTPLVRGQMVAIRTKALEDRTLTSFIIDGVEQLPGALKTYEDIDAPGITAPDNYDPDEALVWYGPVQADVYVGSEAIGVTIDETLTAGVTKTFQMTTTDCLVEAGSWELGETDMPVSVTRSISATGLVSILVPEEVYDGNPTLTYYQDVIFNGYSQVKTLRLIFTVDAVPAFGTVWTAVTKLSEPIKDILYASNGSIIIVTTTKVIVTTDLATFTELTKGGTFTTPFYAATEISGGRIIVADKASIWVHTLGEVGITRQNYSAVTNGAGNSVQLVGSLTSNEVCYVAANSAGVYYRAIVWNVTTGTLVGSSMPLGTQSEIAATACTKPILANDGSFVFAQALAGKYSLARYSGGVMTVVKSSEASYGNTAPVMWKETNGRIFVMGIDAVTPNRHFVRYSDDHGATWTDEAIIGADGNSTLYAAAGLKQNYAIFSQVGAVKRSTDGMATFTTPQTLNGTIAAFAMIGDRKLLAGTDGATTNLYKSEA